MKKETTNTFEGGLIKDLHPLTTPNNVLTDALNATLITYNGNENILLNDMGNSKIDTAKLPAGYIPVGMKEHGGIIYVAAYNPETKKGQVGSFPSPQQLWEGDEWSIDAPISNFIDTPLIGGDIYGTNNESNFIVKETTKYELFINSSGQARIFHPGDKFTIVIDSDKYNKLEAAINKDYLDILLGVIKTDGSIAIMRTWSKSSPNTIFIKDDDNTDSNNNTKASNALKNNEKVNVFDCSSSGALLLIINMHTFDTFNLIRKYSMVKVNGLDKVRVTFTGEATKGNLVLSSTIIKSGLKLSMNGTSDLLSIPVTEGSSSQPPYTIYPNTDFGIVKRMGKTVNIDFAKIRKDEESFGEWRFFVTDTYIKIGWSYDFYNLDGSKEIKYIRMYFHKLLDGYNRERAEHYDLQKEYYNGNFEDYITGLEPNNVYIVEIVKKVIYNNLENEEIICFKMLYLSKLYNSMYNNFFTNTSIGVDGELSDVPKNGEYSRINPLTVSLDLNAQFKTNLTTSKAVVKTPGSDYSNEVDSTQVLQSTYVKEMTADLFSAILDKKLFITKVNNSYDGDLSLKAEFININDDLIGVPNPELIENILNNTDINSSSITYSSANDSEHLEWYKTSNIYTPLDYSNENPTFTTLNGSIEGNIKTFPFTASDMRVIEGQSSEVLNANYQSKGLKPLYAPDYSADKKSKIAPYWKLDEMLVISGDADERETIFYNSTLSHDGSVIEGPDAGGGIDDGGLRTASSRMNNPMTNIFVGMNGDAAQMSFKQSKNSNCASSLGLGSSATPGGGTVIDYQDDGDGSNYAITCWKFTDGNTRFVNLITKKDGTDDNKLLKTSRSAWPRVDVMLRCILSQLFLVNRITKTANYITTDPNNYAYLTGDTKVSLELSYTGSNNITDVMGIVTNGQFKSLNSYLTDRNIWNYSNGKLHLTINGVSKEFPMVNLIPEVSLSLPFSSNKLDITYTIPNYYDLDILLSNYNGVAYTPYINDSSNLDIGAIYSIDVSLTAINTQASANSEGLKPMLDGAFKWSTTPAYKLVTGDLSIYRWNDNSTITFPLFGNYFTTRAKMEEWLDIPEDGLENEVLAVVKESVEGIWSNGGNDAAPDLSYNTLYSRNISLYNSSIT